MKKCIVSAICQSSGLEEALIDKLTVRSQELSRGDYAFPCFVLAKLWQVNPVECSRKLAEQIQLPSNIEKVQSAGPYLNFFIKRTDVIEAVLSKVLKPSPPDNNKGKIVIDFSAPNIAKPFHIGHLRTTLIGQALCNIYRHLGYNVISVNHLGDWGTQFGFVFAGCELWGRPANPGVEELVDLYRRASALRKAQEENTVAESDRDKPNVNQMARSYFVRLESNDQQALEFWQWCLDISLEYFKAIYSRLGISFDYYTGESFYRDKLGDIENKIRDSGLLENSEGALGLNLGKKLGFARIFTEDGRSLYLTRDLATADYRDLSFKPEKILYVVGSPQKLHFEQLIAILKLIKHPAAEKIVHIGFGHVPGMSTRSAPAVTEGSQSEQRLFLSDLLDEARDRALEAYRAQVEKRPVAANELEIAESIGLGAIFFSFLCRSNIKDFHFQWEDALRFQGDTGPYLQYAIARLNSIKNRALESAIPALEANYSLLSDDKAYQLVKVLERFDEAVERSKLEHEPSYVAHHLLELAKTFSSSYDSLRVLGEAPELASARLALFEALRLQLVCGLGLLGVRPVDRM